MTGPKTDSLADPARCIPTLASLDIEQTRAFYVDRLGFAAERVGDYLIARRDAMELHFWLAKDRIHPENTSCYIRGGQIGALYREFAARGLENLSAFEVRPWNMKEFHIVDPHGNLLRFGCIPEAV